VLQDEDLQNFFNQTRMFLIACVHSQVQLAPRLFVTLCRKFADIATKLFVPIQGIAPLQLASAKLLDDRAKRTVTPMDADVLQLCLLAGTYGVAERELDTLHIFEVDPEMTCLATVDFLRYWYYAGMVRCGLKQWASALDCFRIAISSPAQAVSAVVVESYKKMILVSLIETGEKPSLPVYTANIVTRSLRVGAKVYDGIAQKFVDNDAAGLEAEVQKAHDTLSEDNNLGLAKQVTKALTRRRMRRLTDCYIKLSLEDIAQQVGLRSADEAQAQLLWLIKRGLIFATIDESTRMVHFSDGSDLSEGAAADALTAKLEDSVAQVVELSARVEQLDVELSKNPKYLSRTGIGGAGRSPSFSGGTSSAAFGADDMEDAIAIQESLSGNF
jgi:COP9 signalosome complex subunit 3